MSTSITKHCKQRLIERVTSVNNENYLERTENFLKQGKLLYTGSILNHKPARYICLKNGLVFVLGKTSDVVITVYRVDGVPNEIIKYITTGDIKNINTVKNYLKKGRISKMNIIKISTQYCGQCKMLQQQFNQIQTERFDFKLTTIDADLQKAEYAEMVKRYNLQNYKTVPITIFHNEETIVIKTGFMPKALIIKTMDEIKNA